MNNPAKKKMTLRGLKPAVSFPPSAELNPPKPSELEGRRRTKNQSQKTFKLLLKGKTAVFIDWANVHGWEKKQKWQIDLKKLFLSLKNLHKVLEMRFYFGTDTHPASKEQIKEAKRIGFKVITKPVKYLPVKDKNITLWKRKCDFDLEIGLDCFEMLDKLESFVFFTGDGDFATLYKRLIKRKKQVIVIYASGTLGREIAKIKCGLFLGNIKKMRSIIQKISPDRRSGA